MTGSLHLQLDQAQQASVIRNHKHPSRRLLVALFRRLSQASSAVASFPLYTDWHHVAMGRTSMLWHNAIMVSRPSRDLKPPSLSVQWEEKKQRTQDKGMKFVDLIWVYSWPSTVHLFSRHLERTLSTVQESQMSDQSCFGLSRTDHQTWLPSSLFLVTTLNMP